MTAVARRVWARAGRVPIGPPVARGRALGGHDLRAVQPARSCRQRRPRAWTFRCAIVAHIVVYAVLTTLLGWALAGPRTPSRRVIVVAAVLAFLYGISDEWHQTFVPSRTGQAADLIWDAIGVLIGGVLLWAVARGGAPRPDAN